MARIIEIATPLDKDVLLFHTMRGTEEMSRLFEYQLELFSLDGEVDLDGMLGKGITVTLERADGEVRYFNGLCSRVSQGGKQGRYFTYHATVRPWLWFLTRTRNYRIFQEKTVPDILKEMFDEHSSIANVEFELNEAYTPWTYCVQYNESDFAFVSRLMEHEGIYYFFKHTDGKHTLVIADSYSAHAKCYEEEVPFIPPHERIRPEQEHVSEWSVTREVQPVKYALASYDFEKPSVDLQVRSSISRQHALAEYEVFEYGGDYVERGDGELYARMRIEEEQAKFERTQAVTNARAMAPGFLFNLGMHPRGDQNAEYVVVSAEYEMRSGEHEASETPAAEYSCRFTALNTKQPFRAERITPKPVVQGPQTALVVGPGEIHTDNYGRVKVHFYWDRKSQRDDKSSCWIRVSQNWGGKGWGGMFIPHVGQEVIVMFEGGDPDLPLITGRVYNAEQMPPLDLPANKTKSVIRDHGGNELIMEGRSAEQHIQLKQTCGNEILMQGKAGEESIKITDHGGNFIHMNGVAGAEFIHICDKYGNEIKLDAVAKFMRLASPTHNSFIEIGKSLVFTTDSDNKELISANTELTALGFKSENIGGLKSEIIVGVKNEKLFGGYIGFGVSYSYKRVKSVENHVNDATFRQRCVGDAKIDSDGTLRLIGGTGDASKVILGAKHAVIKSGTTEIFLAKDGEIEITNTSGSKISMGGGNIWISCDTLNFQKCKKIDFGGATLERGKTGNFFS